MGWFLALILLHVGAGITATPGLGSRYTVIRSVWVSAKFGTCTVVSVNGTLVEDKMLRFKGECAQLSFDKCPIYTDDGASAKFGTNSHESGLQCRAIYYNNPSFSSIVPTFLPYFYFISKSYASVSSLPEAEFMNIQFRWGFWLKSWEISDWIWGSPYTMFTLPTNFKPLLLKGERE